MIDINYSLRIAYDTALSGITDIEVFYQFAPETISNKNYIVFRSLNSTDVSSKSSSDININVTVEIHTWQEKYNNGLMADVLARDVYNRIYPNSSATLPLNGAQMVSTRMVSDVTQDFTTRENRGYISRFITFKHNIFQTSDIS